METSYNGWPASPDPEGLGVDRSFAVAGIAFPGGVLGGDVAVVLEYVATQLHQHVEPLHDGWCWGYNYRANVNDPESLSCHASATAIDVNAPDHPNGVWDSYNPDQVAFIQSLIAELEGVVTWGGGWADDMHWEISATPAAVKAVADRLRAGGPGGPGQPDIEGEGDDAVTDEDLEQIALRVWSHMVGAGGAGATLEEVRATNRDMNAKLSKLCDPRNGNVNGTG
jgi:hypothetical protein